MGWRRDEVWFDPDVLWFREQPRTPFGALCVAAAAVCRGCARIVLFVARSRRGWRPRGSGGWRRKRARRRRLATRTVPAVALVARVGHDAADRRVRHAAARTPARSRRIPPSLTFRLDFGGLEIPECRSSARRLLRKPWTASSRERRSSRTVDWHRATSVGLPYAGRLVDGTQLPVEGPTGSPGTRSRTAFRTCPTGSTATSTRSGRSSP